MVACKQDKVGMARNVLKLCEKGKQVRKVVVAWRKMIGQPKEGGVTVERIDDMFQARTSPMVVVVSGKKRKQCNVEGASKK